MIYVFPAVYKTILLTFCLSLVFQTLSQFSKIKENLDLLSLADAELIACAQRKANLLNIEEAYLYLSHQNPKVRTDLRLLKQNFEDYLKLHETECLHRLFPAIHASAKKQNRDFVPSRWPNWILAMEEKTP